MPPVFALAMIGEDLNDAAFAHATVATFVDHTAEFVAEGLQLSNAAFDLADVVARDRIDLGAGSLRLSRELEQLANCRYLEPQVPRVMDELEPRNLGLTLAALPAAGSRRRRHQPDLLVIAHRRHLHACAPRQFANRDVHFVLEPLVAADCRLPRRP